MPCWCELVRGRTRDDDLGVRFRLRCLLNRRTSVLARRRVGYGWYALLLGGRLLLQGRAMLIMILHWCVGRAVLGPRSIFLMRLGALHRLRHRRRRSLLRAVLAAVLRPIHLSDSGAACPLHRYLNMAYLRRVHLLHGRRIARGPRGDDNLGLSTGLLLMLLLVLALLLVLWVLLLLVLLRVCLVHWRILLARRAWQHDLWLCLRRL